jgi:hypothetical protein
MKIFSAIILLLLTGTVAMAQIKLADIKEDAWYSIIACHSGKALEIQGAGKDNGLQLQQNEPTGADNQLFQFKQIQSGYFQITVKHSGKVLEVRDGSMKDHAVVQQNEFNGKDYQLFTVVKETGGNYRIIARHSGYGFDVLGGVNALSNNVPVVVYPATGARNQTFKLVAAKPSA